MAKTIPDGPPLSDFRAPDVDLMQLASYYDDALEYTSETLVGIAHLIAKITDDGADSSAQKYGEARIETLSRGQLDKMWLACMALQMVNETLTKHIDSHRRFLAIREELDKVMGVEPDA